MKLQPTVAELRTPQAEDEDFPINRDMLKTLLGIAARQARRTAGGLDVLAPANRATRGGYGSRLGRKPRLLWAAGLAVLGADDVWKLTAAGERRTVQTHSEHAAARAAAGK